MLNPNYQRGKDYKTRSLDKADGRLSKRIFDKFIPYRLLLGDAQIK